jgi:hypothetical protein
MPLPDAVRARLLARLGDVLKDAHCDMCRANTWQLNDSLSYMLAYQPGVTSLGGPIIPLAVLICTRCGQTTFFNAITLGLIDPATGGWIDC